MTKIWKKLDLIFVLLIWLYVFIISIYLSFNSLETKYVQLKNKEPIDNIYNIMTNDNDNKKDTDVNTMHRWNDEINDKIHENISIINDEILEDLGNEFEFYPSMTELYWSSKGNNNSDKQYISTHMDGPFYYCNVYRILVTIDGNKNINTVFPNDKLDINLQKYDLSMFDYNKTSHYIYKNENENDENQRIILKLHYVKSPFKNSCKKVHCEFSRQTRDLFERNKKELYLEGKIARFSLYYYTFRNYVLFAVLMAFLYVTYYNKKSYIIYLLYLFAFIEISIFIYTIHFNFLQHEKCPK